MKLPDYCHCFSGVISCVATLVESEPYILIHVIITLLWGCYVVFDVPNFRLYRKLTEPDTASPARQC